MKSGGEGTDRGNYSDGRLYSAIRNEDVGSPKDYSTKTVTEAEFGKYLNSAAGIPETAIQTILGIISEKGKYIFFSKSTMRWIYVEYIAPPEEKWERSTDVQKWGRGYGHEYL